MLLFCILSLKIIHILLKFLPHLQGANELILVNDNYLVIIHDQSLTLKQKVIVFCVICCNFIIFV